MDQLVLQMFLLDFVKRVWMFLWVSKTTWGYECVAQANIKKLNKLNNYQKSFLSKH